MVWKECKGATILRGSTRWNGGVIKSAIRHIQTTRKVSAGRSIKLTGNFPNGDIIDGSFFRFYEHPLTKALKRH